jgi:preprotein translocase subunit SecA
LEQFGLGEENRQYLDEALRHGIPHNVLNAKYHEREALIIAEAGRKGAVTISTNMAGRGVDILLGGSLHNTETSAASADAENWSTFRRGGKERAAPPLPLDDQERGAAADAVRALGGLFILGTERHESRRIDNQLRGRSGRQGDPGESRYFVSLEDQLWKIFNPKMLENPLLKAWPDLEEVKNKFVSGMIEKTQKRIELTFFEYRKNILEYDDVLNSQREHIYSLRRGFLLGKDPRPTIREYVSGALFDIVQKHKPDGIEVIKWDYNALFRDLLQLFPVVDHGSVEDLESHKEASEIYELVSRWADEAYERKIASVGEENFKMVERFLILQAITLKWTEHLQMIERLREGIQLRGYGQIDPLIAFRKESHEIYEETQTSIRDFVATHVFRAAIQRQAPPPPQMQRIDGSQPQVPAKNGEIDWSKVKRNDPCPCGSGKKFKHCHYREIMGA